MCQNEEQVGPSLWHPGKLEGGRSCLLDRPSVLSRCPLEPGEMVPAWVSQELGSRGGGEDYHVRSCPSRFESLGISCLRSTLSHGESGAGLGALGSTGVGAGRQLSACEQRRDLKRER